MREHALDDSLLMAVRNARPAIDGAILKPTSDEARKMLEQVLSGETPTVLKGAGGDRDRVRLPRRTPTRHISRPRIGAITAAAAAAVAVIVVVLSGVSGGPSLVDRAYAAVNVGDQVLHEVDIRTLAHDHGVSQTVEGWVQPGDGRARVISIERTPGDSLAIVSEWIVTASGRVYTRTCLSGCHPNSFIDSSTGWRTGGAFGLSGSPQALPGTFAQWFRSAYRSRAVVSDGTATFAGQSVARLQSMSALLGTVVFWRPGTPPPASARGQQRLLINWYVDRATAQPVGYTVSGCSSDQTRSCGAPANTLRIATFQRLNPTPQNLALLTGPGAPRDAR